MFLLTTLVYPSVLAVLCVGAGLLVDRASGRFLPAVLLPAVGAAALIAVTQIVTDVPSVAPATPVAIGVVAAGGIALEWRRIVASAGRWRIRGWQLGLPLIVYAVALAPVLASGHASFSAYQVLTDSAFHMMGADFLIRHGQDYSHLDLHNSYGLFIQGYYGNGYPSGADSLFGASAFVVGLPLIWTFQPFNAFMLACAAGPSWLLVRRLGLPGAWAALAALSVTVPALVYAYELVASVKEITALPMILTLGALIVLRERWLRGPPQGAVPFALLGAAGISALGLGFGAWVAAAAAVLLVVVVSDVAARRQRPRQVLALAAAGISVGVIAVLPTLLNVSASAQTATTIGSTANSGNLNGSLQAVQVFGTWLTALYTRSPQGTAAVITAVLIGITVVAGLIGAFYLVRIRQDVFAAWIAALVALGLVVLSAATSWIDAKTLMLSSPIVLLLAWGGVAALLHARLLPLAGLLALVLAGGALASDAVQYHATDLAPSARYDELASLNSRFAGRGPTLFTDFDEYSLYELRDLDVGGPSFLYPPPALTGVTRIGARGSHGEPVYLDLVRPHALLAYPLIVTRIDPLTSRPPSAYRLLWQGAFYEVWGRRRGAPAAFAHYGLAHVSRSRCEAVGRAAALHQGHLVAALAPALDGVDLRRARPRAAYVLRGLDLLTRSRVRVAFDVPHGGRWDLWLHGEIMPATRISIDRRTVTVLSDQLSGTGVAPDSIGPLRLTLAPGRHELTFTPTSSTLAPGAGGDARLSRIFLVPAAAASAPQLVEAPASDWAALCNSRYEWLEAVPD